MMPESICVRGMLDNGDRGMKKHCAGRPFLGVCVCVSSTRLDSASTHGRNSADLTPPSAATEEGEWGGEMAREKVVGIDPLPPPPHP